MNIFKDEKFLAGMVAAAPADDCHYALLIGAGASVSSGIPTTEEMISKWQHILFEIFTGKQEAFDQAAFSAWLSADYLAWRHETMAAKSEYEALFRHVFPQTTERQIFIEQLVDGKRPAFGYLYLAGLIASGRFDRILTTNFDDMVADALVRFYDIRPTVCAVSSSVREVRLSSPRPKVIKLHGDFLYDSLRDVDLNRFRLNMEEKLVETCKNMGLIVVGYGGNDNSLMDSIRSLLGRRDCLNMGLHWCLLRPDKNAPSDVPRRLAELHAEHDGQVFLYMIDGFDQLMGRIFTECGCELPQFMTRNNEPSEYRSKFVFLCHSSSDKGRVKELYWRLRSEGVNSWLDEENLVGGQLWEEEITKAIQNSDVVIVCLSHDSVSKTGYVQKEIRIALDAADLRPPGAIFLIPARLEDCSVPSRLSHLQRVDLFSEGGYDKLLKALWKVKSGPETGGPPNSGCRADGDR